MLKTPRYRQEECPQYSLPGLSKSCSESYGHQFLRRCQNLADGCHPDPQVFAMA